MSEYFNKQLICDAIAEIERVRDLKLEATREKGKWLEREVIPKEEAKYIIDEWQSARCSACGLYHTTPYKYHFVDYKFCPNCGAYMKG